MWSPPWCDQNPVKLFLIAIRAKVLKITHEPIHVLYNQMSPIIWNSKHNRAVFQTQHDFIHVRSETGFCVKTTPWMVKRGVYLIVSVSKSETGNCRVMPQNTLTHVGPKAQFSMVTVTVATKSLLIMIEWTCFLPQTCWVINTVCTEVWVVFYNMIGKLVVGKYVSLLFACAIIT